MYIIGARSQMLSYQIFHIKVDFILVYKLPYQLEKYAM